MTVSSDRVTSSRALAGLGIRGDEARLVLRVGLVFVVIQASHALAVNAADALFFVRFGVAELPLMILLSGPAVMGAILGHASALGRFASKLWLTWVTIVSGLAALGLWAIVQTDRPVVYAVVWITTQVLVMVTFTVMWNTAGEVCTTRQAKRLFPLFATAGVLGGVGGNFLTGPLASSIGTENLLLVQAALLAVGGWLVSRSSPFFREQQKDEGSPGLAKAIGTVFSSRLLKLAAGTAVGLSALFYLVVFPFSEAVAASFETEAAVAGFLGVFSSIAVSLTFLASLLLTGRLFSRFGVVVALIAIPVIYAAGFTLWLADFSLLTAALVRGTQWVAVNAVGITAFNALFNVLTGRKRAEMLAFMTAGPAQVGTMLAGATLIVAQFLSREQRFLIGLVVSLGLLALVLAMRPAYTAAVVQAVRSGLVGLFDVAHRGPVLAHDGELRRHLEARLADPDPSARAIAVAALSKHDAGDIARTLEPLTRDEAPEVRVLALDTICALAPETIPEHIPRALGDEVPMIRAHAIHFVGDSAQHLAHLVEPLLSDQNAEVRAAAAAVVGGDRGRQILGDLIRGGQTDEIRWALQEVASSGLDPHVDLSPFLASASADVRVAAAGAWATVTQRPDELLALLEDESLRVRETAAGGLAATEVGRSILIDVLGSGSVSATDAALRAITPMERFVPDFLTWAGSEAERAGRLASYAAAIGDRTNNSTTSLLKRTLLKRSEVLREWVLIAMTTEDNQDRMSLVRRGISSSDPETRGQAIEALEAIGDRAVLRVLLPLLDEGGRGPALGELEALEELSRDFDPWLRALSVRCLGEQLIADLESMKDNASRDSSPLVREAMPSFRLVDKEHGDILGLMDRVLALEGVPMFSGLDPEDLELIAASASEVRYEPGDIVYTAGEDGTDMLLINEGSVVVTSGGAEVARYGPGEHVGELALLIGGVRSADVRSGEQGTHGLVITKSDLMAIVEQRPAVALGMLSTLAERLVAESDQMAHLREGMSGD